MALAFAFAAFVFALASFQEIGHDAWWHLATGEWMLQNGRIPRMDPFSSTSQGEPWIDHEWLFQPGLALVHRAFGEPGVVGARVLLVGLLAGLLLATVRMRGAPLFVAAGLTVLALEGARWRFQVRPEIVSLLFLVVLVILVTGARDRLLLQIVLPFFALWANLHPSFLMGVVLLGCHAAGGLADRLTSGLRPDVPAPGWRVIARRLVIFGLGAAACLLNPWGARILEVPLRIGRAIGGTGLYNPEWTAPRFEVVPTYFILLGILAVLILVAARRVSFSVILVATALGMFSARFVRGSALFCLAFPVLAALAGSVLFRGRRGAFVARIGGAVGSPLGEWMLAGALCLGGCYHLFGDPVLRFGFRADARWEPVGAVEFLLRERPAPELYNEIGDGGYILWRTFPRYRVFLDGRLELYARLIPRWMEAARGPTAEWQGFLEGHRVRTAVVRYDPEPRYPSPTPVDRLPVSFARAYFDPSRWALVYWDDHNMVLVRRIQEHADLISRFEYRCLHPEDIANAMERSRGDRNFALCLRTEIERRLVEGPESERARSLADLLPWLPAVR